MRSHQFSSNFLLAIPETISQLKNLHYHGRIQEIFSEKTENVGKEEKRGEGSDMMLRLPA